MATDHRSHLRFYCSAAGRSWPWRWWGALAFGGVSGHFEDHPKKIQLWGSFHFLSVGLSVVAAYLVGAFVPSALGWPLAAFAATATYLMVVGFENAAADLERRRS